MKPVFVWIVAFILALTSCSRHYQINDSRTIHPQIVKDICVDNSFSNLERLYIEQAKLNWLISTNYIVNFNLQYDYLSNNDGTPYNNTCIFMKKASKLDYFMMEEDSNKNRETLGYWSEIRGQDTIQIVFDRLEDPIDFIGVSIHEFGHSLGLSHTEKGMAIMNAERMTGTNSVPQLTEVDIQEFCSVYTIYCH